MRRRRRWAWAAGTAAAATVAFVLVWFEPQQLLIDDRVDEALPAGSRVSTAFRGTFVSRDHGTTGAVHVVDLADGRRIVRLEDLETSNGPDLYVYLSANAATGDEHAFDDDYVDLGGLKGNLGDQNYVVPAGTDLRRYRSIVIWCDRFDAAFGAADLVAINR